MSSLINNILFGQNDDGTPQQPDPTTGQTQQDRFGNSMAGLGNLGILLAAIGQPQSGAQRAQILAQLGNIPQISQNLQNSQATGRNTQANTVHTGQETQNAKLLNQLNTQKLQNQNDSLAQIEQMSIPAYQKAQLKSAVASGKELPDQYKALGGGYFLNTLAGTAQDLYGNKVNLGGGGSTGVGLVDPNETPEQTLARMQGGNGSGALPVQGTLPATFKNPRADNGNTTFNEGALSNVPGPRANMIKAVVQGQLPLTSLGSPRNPGLYQQNVGLAMAYDPSFNGQTYAQRQQAFKDFDVGGKYGAPLVTNNTMLQHAADAGTLADQLPYIDKTVGPLSNIINTGIKWWEGNNDPRIAAYKAAITPLAAEAAKASGAPDTEGTREAFISQLDPTLGPAAIKQTLAGWAQKANERNMSLQNQYKNATGFGMTPEHSATLGNPQADAAREAIASWNIPGNPMKGANTSTRATSIANSAPSLQDLLAERARRTQGQ